MSSIASTDGKNEATSGASMEEAVVILAPPKRCTDLLPIHLWPLVLHFLEYTDLAHAIAVCRAMLHQVASLVDSIHFSHPRELTGLSTARRLTNVKIINFCDTHVRPGYACKLVPFLSVFDRLERVDFWGLLRTRLILALQVPETEGAAFDPDPYVIGVQNLVLNLCDGYQSGSIPPTVTMDNLFCPFPHGNGGCPMCRQVLRSFPVNDLFHVEGDQLLFQVQGLIPEGRTIEMPWMADILMTREGGRARLTRFVQEGV